MKPSIGRIVHFVQQKPAGDGEGVVHLPAIITAVWSDDVSVNLQVFPDGTNSHENPAYAYRLDWQTSIRLDATENPQPRTWHWPEREG